MNCRDTRRRHQKDPMLPQSPRAWVPALSRLPRILQIPPVAAKGPLRAVSGPPGAVPEAGLSVLASAVGFDAMALPERGIGLDPKWVCPSGIDENARNPQDIPDCPPRSGAFRRPCRSPHMCDATDLAVSLLQDDPHLSETASLRSPSAISAQKAAHTGMPAAECQPRDPRPTPSCTRGWQDSWSTGRAIS